MRSFTGFNKLKTSPLQTNKYAPTYAHERTHSWVLTHPLTKHENTSIPTITIKPFPRLTDRAVSNEIVSVWHMCLCVFS